MNYHNITKADLLNGEGIRVVLWVSGCSHYCEGCQNKQTWDSQSGILFDIYAVEEILEELSKPWCSGLTISGGDPLNDMNLDTVYDLCRLVKQKYPIKTIWLYTGYRFEDIQDLDILNYIDVLVDGKFEKDKFDINYPFAGSTNQRVIDIPKTLQNKEIILWENK